MLFSKWDTNDGYSKYYGPEKMIECRVDATAKNPDEIGNQI